MSRIITIFFDVGGVCLTNGWDTGARRSAARHFSVDLEELERRHQALADALERGAVAGRVSRSRGLPSASVIFARRLHQLHAGAIAAPPLGAGPDPTPRVRGLLQAGTINNESRELNRYRIDTFRLRDMFSAFFSSCYLRVRKPDARIYEIALDGMQAEPATSPFVDDREENVEEARALGIHTIHVTDLRVLTEQLVHAGVEVPMSGPVTARTYPNGGEQPRRDETAAREG